MHDGNVHRKTCKRWDERFDAHFLTCSCLRRQPFFSGRQSPQWFLDAVGAARDRGLFELWGFVIMPEHAHLVILPAEAVTISRILWAIKRPVGKVCLQWVKTNSPSFLQRFADVWPNGKVTHHFWERGGGYDRNLRSTHDVHEKIDYSHNNPVERGLVQRAEDWPWSSARAWADGTDVPIRIDRETLPILRR
jgi:putative transposase